MSGRNASDAEFGRKGIEVRTRLTKRFTLVVYEGFREDVKLLEDRYAARGLSETVREVVRAAAKKARKDVQK